MLNIRNSVFLVKLLLAFLLFPGFSQAYSSASNEITLIITHGQSLSIGVSTLSSQAVSKSAEYPLNALTLNSGNAIRNSIGWQKTAVNPHLITGFTPLLQSGPYNESPGSGILSALIDSFDQAHLSRPTFLHIHGGHGGRNITELMLRSSDFHTSVANGLSATSVGSPFVVQTGGSTYKYYFNNNGIASQISSNNLRPVYYNNIVEQVKMAVQIAKAKNLRINKDIYFVWIQGQADANNARYAQLLTLLLQRAESDLRSITGLGANLKFHAFLSQLRGGANRARALDIADVANSLSNAHVAAQEAWISNAFGTGGGTGTHLEKIGYRVLGEQIGHSIFQTMMVNQVSWPIISSVVVDITGKVLTVNFSGLTGSLVEDKSIHLAQGFTPPPHFGFFLYNTAGNVLAGNSIVASKIKNSNQVELTLSSPISGAFYLNLGRNQTSISVNPSSRYADTTLRDSKGDYFVGRALSTTSMIGAVIPRYALTLKVYLDASKKIFPAYSGLLTPEP